MAVRRVLAVMTATAILVASGLVHGVHTDRWGLPSDVEAAAARLEQVPVSIGDWSSREISLGERQLEQAEAIGAFSRRYVNRATGDVVTVMILCGRTGPISVHPPTVCFTGAGWTLVAPAESYTLGKREGAATGQFHVSDFRKAGAEGPRVMRTYWGWNATGTWLAPDNPRIEFARFDHLYKMYVLTPVGGIGGELPAAGEDAAAQFMQTFVPELEDVLLTDQ